MWIFNTTSQGIDTDPAIADGRVFVTATDGNVYAINSTTGQQIWTQPTEIGEPMFSSPCEDSGMLYVGARDWNLYCLNETTGSILWKFFAGAPIDASPLVNSGKVVFLTLNGTVYCLNLTIGSLLWRFDLSTTNSEVSSPAMIDANTVVIACVDVYALDMSNGSLLWRSQAGNSQNSPAVVDGKVYVISTLEDSNSSSNRFSENPIIFCLDASNGLQVWNKSLGISNGGLSRASPAVADGMVFVSASLDGSNFYCLNASTGNTIWNFTEGTYNHWSSPAVADGKVFVGADDGELFCLNETTGELFWSYDAGGAFLSSPSIAYGNVYIGKDEALGPAAGLANVYAFSENPPLTMSLTLSLSAQTSFIGFKVSLNGTLEANLTALPNSQIGLSYSINGGQTWNDITSANTADDGSYSAVWIPSATGTYLVKATYVGFYPVQNAQTIVDLSVIPYNDQYVFSVSSNSTVSALAFDSSSNMLNFTVSGPEGTTGYVDMQIAKSLVANIADLKVYLDGNNLDYTAVSTSDSWLLHFTYSHSTHSMSVRFGPMVTPNPVPTNPAPALTLTSILIIMIIIILGSVISLVVTILYKKSESRGTKSVTLTPLVHKRRIDQ